MARTDASLAAFLLSQRIVDAAADPLKASEYWALLDAVGDPACLLGRSAGEMASELGVEADLAERVVRRLDAATTVAVALEEWEQSGLRVITTVDDDYPSRFLDRLVASAPPALYVAGPSRLMDGDMLGVVGSRAVSEAGAAVAGDAARVAAEYGWGLVSGGAKGVDQLAMTAALELGGCAVGMLADSLLRTIRDADTRRLIGDERLCLATPYKPTAGFSVSNAMGRNKLIYALSAVTLVVAADRESGGTWAGAIEAIRKGYAPVVVWTGDGAGNGNAALVDRGGVAVSEISPGMLTTENPSAKRDPGSEPPQQLTLEDAARADGNR